MPERYISEVMRIIKPAPDVDPDDERVINTWVRNQRSEHTRGVYRRDAAKLLRFTGKPLRAIALDDLQAFSASLASQGLAPVSAGRTLAAVRSLMRFASRSGHLDRNVAADLPLPRSENRLAERILGEEEVRRMIALEPDPRNRVLLSLLYTAGLRVSEACRLCWRNLRPRGSAGQITVCGKGGKTRSVLLPAAMWQDLLTLPVPASAQEPVFRSRTGKALDRSRVLRIVQEAAHRAGIAAGVSPHWLRHSHATHSIERGAPIHLVQATLGHASVATTSRYLHARPGQSSAEFIVAR
jgi:integrase/recombinase XerD